VKSFVAVAEKFRDIGIVTIGSREYPDLSILSLKNDRVGGYHTLSAILSEKIKKKLSFVDTLEYDLCRFAHTVAPSIIRWQCRYKRQLTY